MEEGIANGERQTARRTFTNQLNRDVIPLKHCVRAALEQREQVSAIDSRMKSGDLGASIAVRASYQITCQAEFFDYIGGCERTRTD